MRSLWVALGCLTIVPVGSRGMASERELGRSFLWFPLVGLLIGAGLVGVSLLAARAFPPLVAGACVLAAWVAITGALHLDGVGDVADGLYAGRSYLARLRIMKDPHIGAIGVVAVVMLLLLKFALVGSLPSAALHRALLIAPCIGRYTMVWLGSTLPYARAEEGTAAPFVKHGDTRSLLGATAVAVSAVWLIVGSSGWLLAGIALIAGCGLRAVCRRALGGITGDALGASGEVMEVLMLSAVALAQR